MRLEGVMSPNAVGLLDTTKKNGDNGIMHGYIVYYPQGTVLYRTPICCCDVCDVKPSHKKGSLGDLWELDWFSHFFLGPTGPGSGYTLEKEKNKMKCLFLGGFDFLYIF